MAATAWKLYNKSKKNLCKALINLSAGPFRLHLFTTGASSLTISILSSVTTQVSSGNGYGSTGLTLAGITWTAGANASTIRFNYTPALFWSATGTISNIKYAVIAVSGTGGKLLCYSKLSTASFNVTTGNRLTITPAATGVFNLTG